MKTMQLQVADGLEVKVIPNTPYEFLMPTDDVAKGYGVKPETIRFHKKNNADELIEGEHFLTETRPSVSKTHARCKSTNYSENLQSKQVCWTKAGVIRLGFFIKSQRAKLFRNWAEKLILKELDKAQQPQPTPSLVYQPENNRQLGEDFARLAYRELLKIDSKPTRNRLANLIEFFVSQIAD